MDGTLGDGGFNKHLTKRLTHEEVSERLDKLFYDTAPLHAAYEQEYVKRRAAAVAKGTERPSGGGPIFKFLLLWDIITAVLAASTAGAAINSFGLAADDWLTWHILNFLSVSTALLQGIPFAILFFLPWAELTGASRTGYSMRGWLGSRLPMTEIKAQRRYSKMAANADSEARAKQGKPAALV